MVFQLQAATTTGVSRRLRIVSRTKQSILEPSVVRKTTFIRKAIRSQSAFTSISFGPPQPKRHPSLRFLSIASAGTLSFLVLSYAFGPVSGCSPSCFPRADLGRPTDSRRARPPPAWNLYSPHENSREPRRLGNCLPALRSPFRGLSRLPPRLSGSSGFSTRAIPASSPPPPGFNELSRDLGLFLGLLESAAAGTVGRLCKVRESWAPCRSAGFGGHTSGAPGWGCGRLSGPGVPMACAGPAVPSEHPVFPGPGHVQLQRQDRQAQRREAGRVRVGHLPGEGAGEPRSRRGSG